MKGFQAAQRQRGLPLWLPDAARSIPSIRSIYAAIVANAALVLIGAAAGLLAGDLPWRLCFEPQE